MKIAIVGAGVSGLVAAHLLAREHEVVVYEAGSYAGGHTNTIRVDTAHETHHVDTGFIVMNDRNYPNFTRLLHQLGVATQDTNMSFSVKGEDEDFEYAGTPRGLFCQPSNLLSVHFQRMIADLLRFNRELRRLLGREETGESLQDFLARHRFSEVFIRRLIVPQVSAVWSADPRQVSSFPVRFLAEFFANHGMLGFRDRPRWSTVVGGSARYVEALTRPFHERIRLDSPVCAITRAEDRVEVTAEDRGHGRGHGGRDTESFDQVVIAAHSDQALAMLSDASEREREVLGAIPYQRNEAVLHTDSIAAPPPSLRAGSLELPPIARAQAVEHSHLLHEPPATDPLPRIRLLCHAEPHGVDRPGQDHSHDPLLPPGLHARGGRRPIPAWHARRLRDAHPFLWRLLGLGLSRGRRRQRPARVRAVWGVAVNTAWTTFCRVHPWVSLGVNRYG